MDEISYSGNPSNSQIKRKLSKRTILFAIFFVAIILLLGGIVYFVTHGSTKSETPKTINLPTPEVTQNLTPTPTEKVSGTPSKAPTKTPTKAPASSAKNDIKVAVQNGSGESGVAGKAADILKAAGYTIASTGNADNFDYTNVTIKVKASQKSILTELKSDLSSDYTIDTATSDLSEGQPYDALVIIGK